MDRHLNAGSTLLQTVLAAFFSITAPCLTLGEGTLPPIEYVYPDQSVWTTKTNADGKIDDPLLHFTEVLFSKMQLTWTAASYPANRLFKRLQTGESNFSILVRAPILNESCIFSKTPVTSVELRTYRKSSTSPIVTKGDLRGKTVITIQGYSYGEIGKYLHDPANNIVTFEAHRHDSAFLMLKNDRAVYLLDYSGPSEEILAAHPIPGVSHEVLEKLDVFLVLSKTYPDSQKAMDTLEYIAHTIDVGRWGLKSP